MIRSSLSGLAALAAMSLLVAGCGGGGGGAHTTPSTFTPQTTSGPSNTSAATSFLWSSAELAKLPYVGPAKGGGLSLAVQVHMRNGAGLVSYAQSASNPSSPNYRHWLTPAQIASQYGAASTDYANVANYFAKYGLKVGGWPQREMLTVSGSIQQMGNAFGTSFGTYTFRGKSIVAPTGKPKFATTLPVDSIVGLMTATVPRPFLVHNNNAGYYGYSPQQIATGFDYSGAYNAGFTGTGINVGIIGTGPILANGTDADTAGLAALWSANMAQITQVAVVPQPASSANAGTGTGASDANPYAAFATPPPATAPCSQTTFYLPQYQTCNPEDIEAQLDTESIASLAPNSNVLFYLGYEPVEACYNPATQGYDAATGAATCPAGDTPVQSEGITISDDEIQQAIADNTSDVISMSFGGPENDDLAFGYITASGPPGLGQIEMASMVAEGMAVFASSGDDGAWECFDPTSGAPLGTPCVSYPASDPNVVAVGGVNIPLDERGNLTGAITAWADNTTLGGDGSFQNNVGSGGGVSSVFSAPAWQSGTIGNTMRYLPDIALDADPNTGPSVAADFAFSGYASVFAEGGTSAAAPEAAAQWALVLQACKASSTCTKAGTNGYRLGNPSPLFYAIYETSPMSRPGYPSGFTPQLTYAQTFYDVQYGGNQAVPAPGTSPSPAPTTSGYQSGPGYDQVTGLGAPFTGHLIQAVTGTKVP